jgi:hypothetical protein
MSPRLHSAAVTVVVAAVGVTVAVLAARPARRVQMYDVHFDIAPGHHPALAAAVRHRFADLSPVAADAPIEKVGQVLLLRLAGIAPMPVVVREISDSGWVFGTLRGHPAHPARIRFAFETHHGKPRLRVIASGIRRTHRQTSGDGPAERLLTGAARALWADLAAAITERL